MIKFHTHTTGSNDDFSYWRSVDSCVDLDRDQIEVTTEDSGWESMSGSYSQVNTETRPIISLSWTAQNAVYTALAPIIDTCKRYPHMHTFKFFSVKHYRLITGRISKARKIAGNSDMHGILNLANVFILPNYGIVISVYVNEQYSNKYWTVRITPIEYESELDWSLYQ